MHINSYIDEQCIRDFLHTYTQTNKYKQFTTLLPTTTKTIDANAIHYTTSQYALLFGCTFSKVCI